MRKLIFTSAILLTAITLRAQVKTQKQEYGIMKNGVLDTAIRIPSKTPETNPVKPTYRKVVVIPVEDFQALTGAVSDMKATVIYNPAMTAEQAIQQQKAIDAYLKDLPSRVKLDSVKVEGK